NIAEGREIAQAVRQGLSSSWRSRDPTWNENEPNTTYFITIAGLQGLHLDLGDGTQLPTLSNQEVKRAIMYAQFEINGYPNWMWNLVRSHEKIATQELGAILTKAGNGQVSLGKAETLIRHLDEAPKSIQQNLAATAWSFVLDTPRLSIYASEAALKIAATNTSVIDQATFEAEAWRRISSAFEEDTPSLDVTPDTMDVEVQTRRLQIEEPGHEIKHQRSFSVIWGRFWLLTYPDTFCQQWETWKSNNSQAAEKFMLALAAHLGEDRVGSLKQLAEIGSIGLITLKVLYEWICSIVKKEDDIKRESGLPYRPREQDRAQHFRDSLISTISYAKSEHAYALLGELRQKSDGSNAKYLRYVQFMMREEQCTKKPIAQTEYLEFERSFAPSPSEYIEFAMAVETDLLTVKNQIETGEFSLRSFFNSVNFNRIKTDNDGLALEDDFQALLGNELNHAAGDRYAVTLEPILPERTRRDVLCQTGSLRATVELKMSRRWTLNDYIEALEKQLYGQYMVAQNSKIGFFVIVLQKQRRWVGPDGKYIGFDELLNILKDKAREKEIVDSSVHLRIIGIDATPKENFRSAKKVRKISGDAVVKKYADEAGNTWCGRGRRPNWVKDALASGKSLNELLKPKN
ncbi:H-NS family nucleoid-associated regulatory protein, partial [Pseudomonadota bacterium]